MTSRDPKACVVMQMQYVLISWRQLDFLS